MKAVERFRSGEERRGIEVVVGGVDETSDLATMASHFFLSDCSSASCRLSSAISSSRVSWTSHALEQLQLTLSQV